MTIEDQIAALLTRAEPLRCLPDDEASEVGAIVEQINRLRALQAGGAVDVPEGSEEGADAPAEQPKRRGRPPKSAA